MNLGVLMLLVAFNVAVFVLGYRCLATAMQRIHLSLWMLGFTIYSCLGAAHEDVGNLYRVACGIFSAGFVLSFLVGLTLTAPWTRTFRGALHDEIDRATRRQSLLVVVIGVHMAALVVLLVYPEVLLRRLVIPPLPDLRTFFGDRSADVARPLLTQLVQYVCLLTFPLFLIALSSTVKRPVLFAILLLTPGYLEYCRNAYLGRGRIAALLFLLGGTLYLRCPQLRRHVLVGVLLLCPVLAAGFARYQSIRLGADPRSTPLTTAIRETVATETGFPRLAEAVLQSDARADLADYFVWMATLPIPKILTGRLTEVRINDEISEVLLGRPRGARGWYVCLTGLTTESFYLYGPTLFWIHALFLGTILAILCRIVERHEDLTILGLYTAFLFGYDLQRGGISAVLPQITNQFSLFYAWLLYVVWRHRRRTGGGFSWGAAGLPDETVKGLDQCAGM